MMILEFRILVHFRDKMISRMKSCLMMMEMMLTQIEQVVCIKIFVNKFGLCLAYNAGSCLFLLLLSCPS